MNPLVVVTTEMLDGVPQCRGLWVWCPGCEKAHRIRVTLEDGTTVGEGPIWSWNGRIDEGFSIDPSLLAWTGKRDEPEPGDRRCHSFIKDGVWQFLPDCTHALADSHVPMVPVPDWLVRQ